MIFRTDSAKEFYTEERCFIIETLNDPTIKDVSIAQARVAPGVATALHTVEVVEHYYILEGEGEVEVAGENLGKVIKGDVIRIEAGDTQRITNTTDRDLIFLCICLPRFRQSLYTSLE